MKSLLIFLALYGVCRATDYPIELIRVHDGDTIVARIDLGFSMQIVDRIRFAKFDAPELKDAKGVEARDFLSAYLAGKKLILRTNRTDRDNYGRALGIVLAGGIDVAEVMRAKGFGKPGSKFK